MEQADFIQLYLKQKGVNTYLTEPYPTLLKLVKKNPKPRLFESPFKLFLLQAVFGSVIWGVFMWLIVWQFQGFSIYQLYASIFFGVATGLLLAVSVSMTQKRLNISSWDKWLKDNHFD
ncbi:magnesium transporter [Aliivibrio finisterrensis]|uniref:DUF6404 family protein n=1 Tax=Aliivibrio finisterrensis TaxID=511998 RepID=UPI00101F8310|nr:DUF6404 family protein [Aliivibrio finisterrensis]RYU63536.1 magnesium transporter [Aliivibrio finisterrensis]RYU65597.1 magnesium transporter [Aliivibrio finisterrensis]RYU70173.1 magnesium transporter [Aliivibrio finisterrensis]